MHIMHTLLQVLHVYIVYLLPPPIRISVLVGAPKANTSQPGIVEAGAVYYCPWPGLPDSCRQIPFDNSSELPESFLLFFPPRVMDLNKLKLDLLEAPLGVIMFPRPMF